MDEAIALNSGLRLDTTCTWKPETPNGGRLFASRGRTGVSVHVRACLCALRRLSCSLQCDCPRGISRVCHSAARFIKNEGARPAPVEQ